MAAKIFVREADTEADEIRLYYAEDEIGRIVTLLHESPIEAVAVVREQYPDAEIVEDWRTK